jgi:hypothetical protein
MEIKPSYVTFKQAKWLFEKGFNIFTKDTKSLIIDNRYGNNEHYSFYKDATEWNIDLSMFPEFKKRCIITFHEKVGTNSSEMSTLLVMYNLVKGGDNGGIKSYLAPEQWQVVEWLRINYGIWISVDMIYEKNQTKFNFSINKENVKSIDSNVPFGVGKYDLEYSTPQEAYSAAFDLILNKL